MPITVTNVAGNTNNANPCPNGIISPASVKLDISGMTSDEIDANGYLKPGVPLTRAGILVGSGVAVWGVTFEAVKVCADNESGTIAAATDCFVTVETVGLVNRDIAEDNLGRAYTSDEIAGFAIAGTTLHLTTT